jgi:hypothetical protein
MAKFRPGIPDTFTLNVEPVSDLGDYLDEPSPVPQRRTKIQVAAPEEGRGTAPDVETTPVATAPQAPIVPAGQATARPIPLVAPHQAPAPPPAAETQPIVLREERAIPQAPPPIVPASVSPGVPEYSSPVNEDRLPKPKAPRREISMTPETLRMSDELLVVIRSGSGQRDTKANELFHALVLLVHEAMDDLDPHMIPKRGRWGTQTARAYPFELKNAFLRALLRKYGDEAGSPMAGTYPPT